jgi:hypothetical protein
VFAFHCFGTKKQTDLACLHAVAIAAWAEVLGTIIRRELGVAETIVQQKR